MADSLYEKVMYILDESDFNDLPIEERRRIGKYMQEQQILTLYQTTIKDKEHTTEAWRRKQMKWLENCVNIFYQEYRYPRDNA